MQYSYQKEKQRSVHQHDDLLKRKGMSSLTIAFMVVGGVMGFFAFVNMPHDQIVRTASIVQKSIVESHDLLYSVVHRDDFGPFKEYSVIHSDRSLNLMSDPFQQVMRDLNLLLKTAYNAEKVAIIPG